MRINLNYDQCSGLYNLITTLLESYQPENIPESLVDDFMTDISEKLRKKLIAKYIHDWGVKLTPKEAKAFWTFFSRDQLIPAGFEYEQNLILPYLNEIDRIYCPLRKDKKIDTNTRLINN